MEFPLIYLNSPSMNNNLICLKTLSPQHADLQQPSISFHNQQALTVFILLCSPSLPLKFRLSPCSGTASICAAWCTGISQQLDLWRCFLMPYLLCTGRQSLLLTGGNFSRNSAEINIAVAWVDKKRSGAVVLKVKAWSKHVSAPSGAQQKQRKPGWPNDQLTE